MSLLEHHFGAVFVRVVASSPSAVPLDVTFSLYLELLLATISSLLSISLSAEHTHSLVIIIQRLFPLLRDLGGLTHCEGLHVFVHRYPLVPPKHGCVVFGQIVCV